MSLAPKEAARAPLPRSDLKYTKISPPAKAESQSGSSRGHSLTQCGSDGVRRSYYLKGDLPNWADQESRHLGGVTEF